MEDCMREPQGRVVIDSGHRRVTLDIQPQSAGDPLFLLGEVAVDAPPFRGAVRVTLWPESLADFYRDLERIQRELQGRAAIEAVEDEFELNIEMALTGRAEVSGRIGSGLEQHIILTFAFEAD
jgi:hypothetical protein